MADVKLFLSCVSDEFGDYRDELRRALTRPNVEIKIQEDFQAMGGDTLALLETYVESCDVVVHFIGDMAGSTPKPSSVDDLLKRRPELAARLTEKGMDREALGRLHLHPMGGMARDRLQQGRREEEPRHRRAGVWRETRRKIRA